MSSEYIEHGGVSEVKASISGLELIVEALEGGRDG